MSVGSGVHGKDLATPDGCNRTTFCPYEFKWFCLFGVVVQAHYSKPTNTVLIVVSYAMYMYIERLRS